jgi:hypothetical protein
MVSTQGAFCMAVMPIEIATVGDVPTRQLLQAIRLANSAQQEFTYLRCSADIAQYLRVHSFRRIKTKELFDAMERVLAKVKGYHPYLIAFVDAYLDGPIHSNLFGNIRSRSGLAVVTVANVPGVILRPDQMASYFLYYFARYTLGFLTSGHINHEETRGCIFDLKAQNKRDIVKSMKPRPLCDPCRTALLSGDNHLSPGQLATIEKLSELSGEVWSDPVVAVKPKMFIGSSVQGLPIANELRTLLQHELSCDVWNESTLFGLGNTTIEVLEQAVMKYQFGVFVFTPDDELLSRGQVKPVARDNVVFEAGLFIGKLTRWRAFVVRPQGATVVLPSDFQGITTAEYDPAATNLATALGLVCQKIREAVDRTLVSADE